MFNIKANLQNPYVQEAQKRLDIHKKGLLLDLDKVIELGEKTAKKVLQEGLGYLSCQNELNIEIGRYIVSSMPRGWVKQNIEESAEKVLDLNNDDWEYLRLMELYTALHFKKAIVSLIALGKKSRNEDIKEYAENYESKISEK